MTQHADIIRQAQRYTRADFTALRAWLQKVPAETVLRLYYDADDVETRWASDPARLVAWLEDMRDDLISRLSDANPYVAETLKAARQRHSWSRMMADYLVEAADKKSSLPIPSDPVSLWLKPVAARRLKEDGIKTLSDLVRVINARGRGWYKPIPCLGRGKAEKIVAWLRQHEETLGKLPPLEGREPVALYPTNIIPSGKLAPFERMQISAELDGSHGVNRHTAFPLITARNDLDAVEAYLYRFRGHDHTYRAYQKELERFLLWCIVERGKALSSVLVSDCESYKDFLSAVPERWIGLRQSRRSPHWKPFASQPSAESQRYAVQILRAFFEWLVKVRYLAANPWIVVQDPQVERHIKPMRVEKALPSSLWDKLSRPGGILDELSSMSMPELIERYRLRGFRANHAAQVRLVKAMLLMLVETGMRREELAYAVRRHLYEYQDVPGIWKLDVLGKRSKWRSVYMTQRTIDALAAHWQDRNEDFFFGMSDIPLVAPVIVPPAPNPTAKHSNGRDKPGFSPDGIHSAITTWLVRIAQDRAFDLTEMEREQLRSSAVHSFRHTFGTLAVADGMPLDVVQKIMGHASLNTTTIYVRSEEQRAATEIGKWATKRLLRGG